MSDQAQEPQPPLTAKELVQQIAESQAEAVRLAWEEVAVTATAITLATSSLAEAKKLNREAKATLKAVQALAPRTRKTSTEAKPRKAPRGARPDAIKALGSDVVVSNGPDA